MYQTINTLNYLVIWQLNMGITKPTIYWCYFLKKCTCIWKMIQDYSPTVQSCLHYSIKFEWLCEVWILSIQAGKKLSLYLMFVGKRASWCTIKWRMYVYISRNTLVHFFWWTSTSWNQAEMGYNMYQSCSKNLTNYGLVIHLEMYQVQW